MKRDEWILLAVVLIGAYWLYSYVTGNNPVSAALQSTLNSDAPVGSGSGGLQATILAALSSFENVAGIHNNPGGICGSYDADGNCKGPATFPSLEDGEQAAENLIGKFIDSNPGITVGDFVKKWSGAVGQQLSNYQHAVASALGLSVDDPIAGSGASGDEAYDGEDTDAIGDTDGSVYA
jgi:hypothetical protein